MIEWFKGLFSKPPAPAPAPRRFDIEMASLAELDDANVLLGQRIDEIRAQRKALVARAAELRDN